MRPLRVRTATRQVAAHLREELLRGTWGETMPGTARLARELGVGMRTVADALERLENEGLLVNQGRRRKRRIQLPENAAPPGLRVAILPYEAADLGCDWMTGIVSRLLQDGHQATLCDKGLIDLGMNTARIRRFVRQVPADAWIVFGGSREVLEWFSQQPVPAFALAGRYRDLSIAGTGVGKPAIIQDVVHRLTTLGHRRFAMIAREERRKPTPGMFEQRFLDQLEADGITTGPYNLPDWANHPAGLHQCLDGLFKVSAPTALIVEIAPLFIAVQQYLALRGITAPRDVSLVCGDADPSFGWCSPTVAHIAWEPMKLIQRVSRWTNEVARGINKRRQSQVKATFVDGGTIGPVPKGR